MIIKVKRLSLVFCENFMSTETFTLCPRKQRGHVGGGGGSNHYALKLVKPPGGRLPVLSANYVPVNDGSSS